MRSLLTLTTLLAACTRYATAQGIVVAAPAAGAQLQAGTTQITLADSGTAPGISLLATAQIALMVGGNTVETSKQLAILGSITFPATALAVNIAPGLAASVTNGFYLKVISNIKDGGTVVNYSNRFSIAGMVGTTEAVFVTGATTAGSAVPALQYSPAAAAAPAAPGGDQFNTPYNLQIGLTKYAPMQPVPPTKITKRGNPTPLYSTSAYTVATAWLPRASIVTTITQGQTASYESIENPAAAQSLPTGDMAKFLARWKD